MPSETQSDFSYRALKDGRVQLLRSGRVVQTLKGLAGVRFLERVAGLERADAQRLMASSTGQYRFGNERRSRR